MNTPRPLAVLLLCLAGTGSLSTTTLAAAAPPSAEAPPADADGPPEHPHCHGPRDGERGDRGPRHWRGEDRGPGPEGAPVLRLLRGLDLSQAQRDKIHELMQKNRAPHRELMARRFALHEAFADLDPLAPDYRKKVDKLAGDAAGLAQETLRFDARVTAELVAQLSPEQAKTLQSRLAQRREQPQERREHRRDGEDRS